MSFDEKRLSSLPKLTLPNKLSLIKQTGLVVARDYLDNSLAGKVKDKESDREKALVVAKSWLSRGFLAPFLHKFIIDDRVDKFDWRGILNHKLEDLPVNFLKSVPESVETVLRALSTSEVQIPRVGEMTKKLFQAAISGSFEKPGREYQMRLAGLKNDLKLDRSSPLYSKLKNMPRYIATILRTLDPSGFPMAHEFISLSESNLFDGQYLDLNDKEVKLIVEGHRWIGSESIQTIIKDPGKALDRIGTGQLLDGMIACSPSIDVIGILSEPSEQSPFVKSDTPATKHWAFVDKEGFAGYMEKGIYTENFEALTEEAVDRLIIEASNRIGEILTNGSQPLSLWHSDSPKSSFEGADIDFVLRGFIARQGERLDFQKLLTMEQRQRALFAIGSIFTAYSYEFTTNTPNVMAKQYVDKVASHAFGYYKWLAKLDH